MILEQQAAIHESTMAQELQNKVLLPDGDGDWHDAWTNESEILRFHVTTMKSCQQQ